ncbi:major facilitator superfamily domain-containing protein [Vararia minispora EC-137]|uniref:Major facilitator superfamily domain-containing protein n=1 Tax=Vararia minispora EC-137 TaxID=1314806 RepID=A0ACB8QD00_9AGAM|nr:major facilitator superfamily domain-containing protein [Vararia minispora EC-137]
MSVLLNESISLTPLFRGEVENSSQPDRSRDLGSSSSSAGNALSPGSLDPPNYISDTEDERVSSLYRTLLLLAGFMMIFQTIGINQTYGIFQEFYTSQESNILDAAGNDALVSLVGTIGSGLTWSGCILVSPLLSLNRPKIISLVGAILMSLGIVLASFASKLWHLFLTQSFLYGIGSSLLYYPILAFTPPFFDRRRGAAMGFVLSGSGAGGLVMAPALRFLLAHVGIRWTLRILGLWNLVVCVPVACAARTPPGYRNATRISLNLAKQGTFLFQSLGAFLQAAGNVIPLYYLTTYSTSVLAYSSATASLLLALNSAVNSVSRIGMGFLADSVGRQNTMVFSVILSGASVLALWLDANRTRFIVFTIAYGVYAGGYNALLPTTLAEVYGVQNYAAVNAAVYFIRGLGAFFGAPVAGVILGTHERKTNVSPSASWLLRMRYDHVVLFDGALLLGAGACMAYVRWLDAKKKGRWMWKA